MHQFHTIFESNRRRYSIKKRDDGHVSFRDLSGNTTGVRVTPEQEAVLTKMSDKITAIFEAANIPALDRRAAAAVRKSLAPKAKAATKGRAPKKAAAKRPGRPAKG